MQDRYDESVSYLKALADTTRVRIVDMLSCGELCACEILEYFSFTQPTLSHHMKLLCDCGLVVGRKEGKWTYYTLDSEVAKELIGFLTDITTKTDDCICEEKECSCG